MDFRDRTSSRWMIEDDPYGEISFGDIEPALIARRDPDHVIYLGSFSKSVAPSLRLGFIRANRSVLERLEPLKQATDLHSSTFTQGILRELLTHGDFSFTDHIARICQAYRAQRDMLIYLGRPDASTMRLNFSNVSQDQIPDAVARLATAFRDVYGG